MSTPIWRYVDLTKFIDLISTSKLFFSRADRLDDPFEGTTPMGALERRKADYVDSEETFKFFGREMIESTYVSCWHLSEHESAAMWKLYLLSNEGLAIRSSCDRLIDALTVSDDDVYIALVNYINYARDDYEEPLRGNFLTPFVHKRKSFEHEKELRAIVSRAMRTNAPSGGIRVSVDLPKLIDSVYVSPDAPDWFHAIVKDVIFRYGLNFNVHRSDLAIDPVI